MSLLRTRKNIIEYLLSYALTTVATALPHAVLTIILFQKGLSLAQIMMVQTAYSIAVFIFEYPSGLWADLYSKKFLFVLSRILLIIMMVIVLLMRNTIWMEIAWFIYGISSALDSGTLDADIINSLKKDNKKSKLGRFISISNQLDFISLLLGSTIGSWLYYALGIKFYYIGIGLVILAIISILDYKQNVGASKEDNITLVKEIKSGLKEVKNSKLMQLMMALTFSGQFFFQAHYQLWQGLFLYKGFNKHNFYLLYIIFQLISLGTYSINLNIKKNKIKIIGFSTIVVLSLSMILFLITKSYYFVFSYMFLIFIFTLVEYYCNIMFSTIVSVERISSLTSLRSSIGRIGAICSMVVSSILLTKLNVLDVVAINFGIAIFTTLAIGIVLYSRNRETLFSEKEE